MVVQYSKFNKIKPYIRQYCPTGIYFHFNDIYKGGGSLNIEDIIEYISKYSSEDSIKRVINKIEKELNIEIDSQYSKLPLLKSEREIESDDSDGYINKIMFDSEYEEDIVIDSSFERIDRSSLDIDLSN